MKKAIGHFLYEKFIYLSLAFVPCFVIIADWECPS